MDIRPSTNRLYFALFLAVFAAIAVVIILFKVQKNPEAGINNFNDCVKAGYPVTTSDIEQCTLPSGKFFVNQTIQEK